MSTKTVQFRDRVVALHRVRAGDLKVNEKNWRRHPEAQRAAMREALASLGFANAVLVRRTKKNGPFELIDGHLRAELDQDQIVPALELDVSEAEANRLLATLDPLAALAEVDQDKLSALMAECQFDAGALDAMLKELLASQPAPDGTLSTGSNTLATRFLVPPFSVLDGRAGYWQERKAAWLSLGIKSEVGRGENLLKMSETVLEPDPKKRAAKKARAASAVPGGGGKGAWLQRGEDGKTAPADPKYAKGKGADVEGVLFKSDSGRDPRFYEQKRAVEQRLGRELSTEEFQRDYYHNAQRPATLSGSGTSVFDPVLCELIYRWFCPPGGDVLDPFAGGSVRGIVAGVLGRRYIGVDLRSEQVAANEAQAAEIDPALTPRWIVGDSRRLAKILKAGEDFDLVFSCPPYFDLELYSDLEEDISNSGSYEEFVASYREIIAAALARLRANRFSCFVVGDIRGKDGFYRRFIQDTISAFEGAGSRLYNEAILVQPVGSLPIRAAKQFSVGRKLGKTHQNVLVFCNGDPKAATAAIGEVEVGDPDQFAQERPAVEQASSSDAPEEPEAESWA